MSSATRSFCQRESWGRSSRQGPQLGWLKTSSTGRPRLTKPASVSRPPSAVGRSKPGAGEPTRESAPGLPWFACSTRCSRSRIRPFWRRSWNHSHAWADTAAQRAVPPRTTRRSVPVSAAAAGSSQTTTPARATSPALRLSVGHPAGAECRRPKQWQSGCRPRMRASPMASENALSKASAARAPKRPDAFGTRAAAAPSSTNGSKRAEGRAIRAGTPKPTRARLDPSRSRSFATPATPRTAASSKWLTRRKAAMFDQASVATKRPPLPSQVAFR